MLRILVIAVLLLCALQVRPQSYRYLGRYNISRLTPDDGLSQGSNYFRFEDSQGFMWISANDAVNRYDGSFVKVYNLDKYFINCPNLQQVYGFAEDDKSNIYAGSIRGLYIYHRNLDKFSLRKLFKDSADQTIMPVAFKKGIVWCFNKRCQLIAYDIAADTVTRVIQLPLPARSSVHIYDLPDDPFYFRWPFIDTANNIWFINRDRIVYYDIDHGKVAEVYPKLASGLVFNGSYYDPGTNMLQLGTDEGLLLYNTGTGAEKMIREVGGILLRKVSLVARRKNIIALRSEKGLLFMDMDQETYHWVAGTMNRTIRLQGLGFDKSGRFWACDDGLGQVIYNFSPELLARYPGADESFQKLQESGVGSFAEFPNGDVILQGDVLLDHSTGNLKHFDNPDAKGFKGTTDVVRKGVWLYENSNYEKRSGIYFARNNMSKATLVVPLTDSMGVLQHLEVLNDGNILCAFSNAICRFDPATHKMEPLPEQPAGNSFYISKLSGRRIAVSYLNGNMWLAEKRGERYVFTQTILPGVQSFYLQEDKAHQQYWAGTNQGVYLLDKHFNTLQKFDANTGLAGTNIYGILTDDTGNIWCSHQRGLSSIDRATHRVINYGRENGIQDWDFNNRSFYKAADGTLYFGGVKGFNSFKPPVVERYFYLPEIYVDEIRVNNKTFLPDSNAALVSFMHLAPGENNISFHAIVKDLEHGKDQQILYRLNDNTWTYLPNNSTINFNSLASGKYKLELATYNKFRHHIDVQKTIIILIDTPFYRSIIFWTLISILLTSLILWLLYRRRYMQQQRKYRQQLAVEQERLKITSDLHDDIGASLSSLQLNSAIAVRLIAGNTEAAKTVLEKIERQSKLLLEQIGDFIWSMKPGKDEFMTLSSRIKTFAAEILGSQQLHYTLTVDKAIDQAVTEITARKNILLIFKEAVNNAVKYSKAGNIDIAVALSGRQVILSVSDNGIGMDTLLQKGNGLANMQKRSKELNGHFEIRSAPGKGTAITVIIPVP